MLEEPQCRVRRNVVLGTASSIFNAVNAEELALGACHGRQPFCFECLGFRPAVVSQVPNQCLDTLVPRGSCCHELTR